MLTKILNRLMPYFHPIYWACALFPFIAGLFTLPFVIRHYRKYGGIAVLRVMVVRFLYSILHVRLFPDGPAAPEPGGGGCQ